MITVTLISLDPPYTPLGSIINAFPFKFHYEKSTAGAKRLTKTVLREKILYYCNAKLCFTHLSQLPFA